MVFTDYLLTVYTQDGRTIYSTFETEDDGALVSDNVHDYDDKVEIAIR